MEKNFKSTGNITAMIAPPATLIYCVMAKNIGKYENDGSEGPVYAFTKEKDAESAVKYLNERMKEHGTEYRKYSVQIIHLFKKTLKPL
jgi:hypothetical protein